MFFVKMVFFMALSMCAISINDVEDEPKMKQLLFGMPRELPEYPSMSRYYGYNLTPLESPPIQDSTPEDYSDVNSNSYPGFYSEMQPQGYYPLAESNPAGQIYLELPPTNFGHSQLSDIIELLKLVHQSSVINEALKANNTWLSTNFAFAA